MSSSGIKKIETIHWNGDINDRPAHQKAIDDVSFQINQASKEGRPVVIISHSKGGLIAYESALSLDPKNSKSKVMLVTLNTNEHLVYDGGSQSKALPANVNWVNFYSQPLSGDIAKVDVNLPAGRKAGEISKANINEEINEPNAKGGHDSGIESRKVEVMSIGV